MSSKEYNLPEIGAVVVRKQYNAKRIILKIKQNHPPTITIPKLMPFNTGYEFAREKADWIKQQQKKISEIEVPTKTYDTNTIFKTRFASIQFQYFKGGKITSHFKDQCYYLLFPSNNNMQSTHNQLIIKQYIIEVLRTEAKKNLPERTKILSDQFGFTYKKVFVKNLKSRWGSCSSQNNINLNLHLMQLPEHLSDFIILHELCHTIHKNHGKEFHDLLNKLVGNEKELNKELKQYNTYL